MLRSVSGSEECVGSCSCGQFLYLEDKAKFGKSLENMNNSKKAILRRENWCRTRGKDFSESVGSIETLSKMQECLYID